MGSFFCNVIVRDDVNGEDLSNLFFVSEHSDSDACMEALKTTIDQEIERLHIGQEDWTSRNMVIVEAACQLVSDGVMDTARFEAEQPASFRKYCEHL